MRTICSWCGAVIREEDGTGGKDSHGICINCAESELKAEAQALAAARKVKEEKDDDSNL